MILFPSLLYAQISCSSFFNTWISQHICRLNIIRSIPEENLEKINTELEKDVMIRAIHDVKGIDMGSYLVRYKAELDFDGRELTRAYLDKQDLNEVLEVSIFAIWTFTCYISDSRS